MLNLTLSRARASSLSLSHTHTHILVHTHTHTHTNIWTEQLLLERRHLLETIKQQLKGAAGHKPYENTHTDTQNTFPCSHPHTYNAKHEEDARTPLCTKNEKTQDTSTPARGGAEPDRGAAASINGGGVSCSGEGVQGVDEEVLHIFERSVSSHY